MEKKRNHKNGKQDAEDTREHHPLKLESLALSHRSLHVDNVDSQVAQLSQKDRAAGWVSFGQK